MESVDSWLPFPIQIDYSRNLVAEKSGEFSS